MFINDVKKYVKDKKHAFIQIIKGCGHVVNVEASKLFNDHSINFLISQSKTKIEN